MTIIDNRHKPVGNVGGFMVTPSATVTRPANTTQYAANDLIANSASATAVTAMEFTNVARYSGGSFSIRRARMTKDDDDVTAATFRLHLFAADPFATDPQVGDNGTLVGALNATITDYLGSISFDMTASPDIYNTAGNAAIGVPALGNEINAKLSSGTSIYGVLEATGTYTPASGEIFTLILEVIQD